jgi:hypothetical protein
MLTSLSSRGRRMGGLATQQRMNAEMGDSVWFLVLAILLAGLGIVVRQVV